jgi:hypothetical protein
MHILLLLLPLLSKSMPMLYSSGFDISFDVQPAQPAEDIVDVPENIETTGVPSIAHQNAVTRMREAARIYQMSDSLTQEELQTLRVLPFEEIDEKTVGDETQSLMCAICLTDYEPGDILREMYCSHMFHKSCVDEWLLGPESNQIENRGGHRTCPVCIQVAVGPQASCCTIL